MEAFASVTAFSGGGKAAMGDYAAAARPNGDTGKASYFSTAPTSRMGPPLSGAHGGRSNSTSTPTATNLGFSPSPSYSSTHPPGNSHGGAASGLSSAPARASSSTASSPHPSASPTSRIAHSSSLNAASSFVAATTSSSSPSLLSSTSSPLFRTGQPHTNTSSSSSSVSQPSQQHIRAPAGGPETGQKRSLQQQRSSDASACSSAGTGYRSPGGIAVTLKPSSGFAHPPTAPAALASSHGGITGATSSQHPRFTVYSTTRQAKVCPYCGPGAAGGFYGNRSGGGRAGGAASTIVFDTSSGDQICRECGFVVEEKVLSEEQEWRNFSAEVASSGRGGSNRNRVGEALDTWLEGGGIGTSMLVGSAGGLASGSRAATAARRLQQLHEATTSNFVSTGGAGARDKQLKAAFACLRLIGEAFALRDNVLERAKEITKDIMQENQQFPRTRNNTTTMLAVTYLACREAGVTRTVKELVVYDRAISEKELGKAINRIKKQVPQRGDVSSAESATQLLPRYCSRLQLSVHISDVAEHVAKRAAHVIISSHRPNSIAGAAIWLVVQLLNSATNPHLPKASEIASVTGAGEHTLRSIYKDMLDVAEHLLPVEFQPTVEGGLEGLRARNSSRKRKGTEGS